MRKRLLLPLLAMALTVGSGVAWAGLDHNPANSR